MRRGVAALGVCALAAAGCGGSHPKQRVTASASTPTVATSASTSAAPAPSPPRPRQRPRAPFVVGLRVVTFLDTSRTIHFPGRPPGPRPLSTLIRYPALGAPSGADRTGARPARAGGPFPLIVFGHGYSVTPGPYAALLRAWARAGYVVAAPIFPLENANAPGGPDESDLVNQPRDMSFVISSMLGASARRSGFLSGLIERHRIVVTGQSDGGETALAVAYDDHFIDRRVTAAAILSGAKIPGVGGFDFPAPSPPLLATQGTADTINPPSFTHAFFDAAPSPKYLLNLFGAPHLGPYTDEEPQVRIVERVTIAFFDKYLKHGRRALARMLAAGNVPGTSAIQADP